MKKFDWLLSRWQKHTRRSRGRRRSSMAVERLDERQLLSAVWVAQGPTTAQNGQVEGIADREVIGAVHALLADPTDPNTMFLGAVNGGVWRTHNALADDPSWTPLFDNLSSLSIGAMAMDPANHLRILVGIGRVSSLGGYGGDLTGVVLSENGGDSWTEIKDPLLVGRSVIAVEIRGDILLTATPGGLFRRQNATSGFESISGKAESHLPAGAILDLVGDPASAGRFYVAVQQNGIYRSDDFGATWTSTALSADHPDFNAAMTDLKNFKTEIAVANNGRIYVGVVNNNQLAYVTYSDNHGDPLVGGASSWIKMDLPSLPGSSEAGIPSRSDHFSIAADPIDPNTIYIGGSTDRLFRGNSVVGATGAIPSPQWEPLTHSIATAPTTEGGTAHATAPHADSRDITFVVFGSPATALLIEGDDGGVNRRTHPLDNTGDWFSMIGNLAITEMHDIAYDSNSNILISGNQDTGTTYQLSPGSKIWDSFSLADGGDVTVDTVSRANMRQSIRYTSSQKLGSFAVSIWDENNRQVGDTTYPPLQVPDGADEIDGLFINPVILNTVDPSRLMFGGYNGLYESTNRGANITQIGAGVIVQNDIDGYAIAYGGRRLGVDNPDLLYVAHGPQIYVRTSAGTTLTATAALPDVTAQVMDIAIDPNDWMRAWAVDGSHLYQTTDGGTTWSKLTTTGLNAIDIRTIEYIEGRVLDGLVVGGIGGAFKATEDDFTKWSLLAGGLPRVPIRDMQYNRTDDLLAVGTFGRGAWTLPYAAGVVDVRNNSWAMALGGPGHDDPVGLVQTTDGGFVVAGTTTSIDGQTADLFASKFDPRGNLVWSRTYAASLFVPVARPLGATRHLTFDYATDIEPTTDGGVVVTGYSKTSPGAGGSGLRVLIDSNGDVVGGSTQTFALSPEDRLTSAAAGGNLIGGNVTLSFDRNTRVGNNGFQTVLGSKTFAVINGNLYGTRTDLSGGGLSGHTSLRQLISTSSGGTAVVGQQGGGTNFHTIVHTDAAGIVGLSGAGANETGVGIVETPADVSGNRFYGVLSSTVPFGSGTGDPEVVVRKLDSSLNVIWERFFGGAPGAIQATADGGFVIASLAAFNRVQLVRLSASGQLVWAKQYDGRGVEGLTALGDEIDLITTPFGYAFTVPTTSFGPGDSNTETRDFWVVKTDADGNVPIMTGLMTDITAGFTLTPFTGSVVPAEFVLLPGPIYDDIDNPPPDEGDYDYIDYANFYGPQHGTVLNSVVAASANGAPREQSTPFYNAGSFQFATSTYQTTEDGTLTQFVDVIVTRTDATHGSYGAARVNFTIALNGSTSVSDFSINQLSGGNDGGILNLHFADGETSQTAFRIYANSDNDFDPGESITITLLDHDPLNGAVIGSRASTTVTAINTNPAPGIVQFSSPTYSVNENKPSVTITVERTNVTETDMQVSYAVVGGTATGGPAGAPGRDYETDHQTSGTFLFDNGRTSQTFTIPIIDDPDVEGDETILLQLSNPTNGGQLGSIATATVTIRDIQPPPPLAIIPKFNGKIAYIGYLGPDDGNDLFVANANGSAVTNLTNAPAMDENSPAWSPDGSKLAFTARGSDAEGNDISGIYVINADGTGRSRVTTSFRDSDPTWSPNGMRLVYVHGDPFVGDQLVTIDPDGTDPETLITVIGVLQEPKWSPDGTHITYEGRPFNEFGQQLPPTLLEIGVDGFGSRRLFPSFSTTFDGSYTPDGTQMVFRGTLDGADAIFRANIDGTGTPERLSNAVDSPSLSPDGTRLVYFVGGFEAFVAASNVDGSSAAIFAPSIFPGDPTWQPLLFSPAPDTQAPSASSVTPSVASITDDHIGEANFSLTVVFNEAMTTSVIPSLSFPVENPNSTLTFNAAESGWTNSLIYVAKYNVVDAGKTQPNIDVRVTGGQDLAGNTHVATTSANEFGIAMAGTFLDMTPPVLTAIQRSNPLSQQTTAATLVFLVSFNEELDPASIDPTDFVVVGSTATITSVVPDLNFGAVFSEITISGGNLATFVGSVGLSLNANTDIVDAVGNPLSLLPPETNETYLHGAGAPNRVPSFTKGANQTVLEDFGQKTVANWATNISAGTGEAGQAVDFQVTNNNNALFSSQPAISHNGTLTFTAAANAFGTATVTVRIHDDGGTANGGVDTSAAQTFTITVTSVNDLPTSTSIAAQVINEDSSTGPISFTIGDVETAPSSLTLKVLSTTNKKLIPLSGVVLGGSGANRTLTITPAANQFGTATVAFTIKDANGGVLTQNVLVTVNPVNDAPPTISNILDVTVAEDTPTAAIKFTVDDVDDKLINLNAVTVTATSSNTDLVPNSPLNIVLGGSAGARTIQLKPALDQSGATTITVTVTDSSGATATDTFVLTVNAVNDAPRITAATLSVPEFTTNDAVVGTVAAVDPEGHAITAFAIAGGNTGNAFKIDNAGVIRVNDATKIDFEALAKYTLTIKATDALGAAGSKSHETGPITINVEDQDFAFTIDAVDTDNTVTVSKVGNNLVTRRGLVDLITPTSLDDVTSLTITGGTAKDMVVLDVSLNSAGTPATKKFTGQILVNGNAGDDKLDASKINVATIGITFSGGAGNDTALGGSGNDTLVGDGDNDSLDGGSGNDQLTGGGGNDALLGGKGDDTFLFSDTDSSETDTLTEASKSGTDTLDFSGLTTAVTVNLISETALATHANRVIKTNVTGTTKLAGNFENVIGGSGDDGILGNAAANNLQGGTGQDTIKGGVGNDSLSGGAGNDAMLGDDGNDLLNGDADTDTLIGGAGNDSLRGGDGDDTAIGGLGNDLVFGDSGTDLGLGGKGGPARGGASKKESGDVLNASLETIDEAFATVFGFEL